ncbi:GTP 3',8-cyclase MoaA [Tissierella sp. Yu-01]|uniref:GTP 3',8-cyclase MoaA n=1 Tax=Tissierella sp. Yu-01 TaxID=3035694 RepID=UPI00240E27FD|nr:GTP 3',8-cyclase MoaA [Tissierella sp. Yu-01]WFA08181.1 GTP 3',8-cyclase MoaA [Tissierella sp. Yu-01]
MKDSFGREINYLRISLTDRCNLRCEYCMPEKGVNKLNHEDILNFEEMFELIKVFVELGINKIRLTGGEPLVRLGVVDFISKISKLNGIKEITMTTNGTLLKDYAQELRDAGLNRINISLDTLDKDKYREITRGGELSKVLDGIEAAKDAGLTPIKINTVLIGGFNDDEIPEMVNLTKEYKMDVRFIELMPIGEAAAFASHKFIPNSKVLESVKELEKVQSEDISSPATYFKLPDGKGKVGIINPISCKFCSNCNRVRLTSTGKLKLCLHSNREIDLKNALRNKENIKLIISNAILTKEEEHHLEDKEYITRNMNQIGG